MTRQELAQVKADYKAEIEGVTATRNDIMNYFAMFCLDLAEEMCYNHHERGQRLWAFAQALKEMEITDE